MTKREMPTQADRAYFFHLQGLAKEWIAHRLQVSPDSILKMIRDGEERAFALSPHLRSHFAVKSHSEAA